MYHFSPGQPTDYPTHLLSWKSGNLRNSPFLLHRTTAEESTVEQWSAAAARSFITTTSVGSTEKRKSGANDAGRGAKLIPERRGRNDVINGDGASVSVSGETSAAICSQYLIK